MTTSQIIQAVFGYGGFLAILVFIILVWRSSLQIVSVLKTFSAVGIKNAEASEKSAIAAQKAAEAVKLLVEQGHQEQTPL